MLRMFGLCFLVSLSLIVTSVADSAETSFSPSSVEEISPCCTADEISDGLAPSSSAEPRFVIHGNPIDAKTFKMLKQKAKTDPNVKQIAESELANTPSPDPSAPALSFKFVGNGFVETRNFNAGGSFFPPDTILAVGPNHLLEASNGMVRLSSKTNTNVQKIGLAQFLRRGGKFVFDPKVYYDLLTDRFFVLALERDLGKKISSILLAVSRSSNPTSLTSGWCFYRIQAKVQNSWADFPSIGLNQNWFAVNVNNFDFNNFSYFKAFFRVISIKTLTNNTNSCPKLKVFNFPQPDFNINPAQHYTADSPDLFAVNHFGPSRNYGTWRVTGNASPKLVRGPVVQSQSAYSIPPDADQPSGSPNLNTGDNRILHLAYRSGVLHGVHTTACNVGGGNNETCVRLFQIDPDVPAVIFESDLAAGSNKFLWNPSIAINKRGDVTLAMQQSGSATPLSTSITGKRVSGNRLEALKIVQKGSCPLNDIDGGGRNRTGDYTGANLDPADEITVWIAGEFTKRGPEGCKWSTVVAKTKFN